ncbi:hypothetical protein H9639_16475 [Arthrobacter sp. Sa2CUA1]|uniref:Uncharacterized protein n=1 Tax=Arthrobacter gallicola TaxID=2762225 RepID=A0ABR8UWH5_9MICC|nr:hypothetical protein [Arthrobacter gallicola]MBD7996890.1 hypothetical protein [Arthrobacter gallicola]
MATFPWKHNREPQDGPQPKSAGEPALIGNSIRRTGAALSTPRQSAPAGKPAGAAFCIVFSGRIFSTLSFLQGVGYLYGIVFKALLPDSGDFTGRHFLPDGDF